MATPLQALLVAERAAVLSGDETDFVMNLFIAYTGARWSEAIGLPPGCVREKEVALHWKLYELNGLYYQGRPKDGSMRTADLPPFLSMLLSGHLEAKRPAVHLPQRKGALVSWRQVRLPRAGERALPQVQLQRADVPPGRGRQVPR